MTPFEVWFERNADRMSEAWEQHLSEMQDSYEHISYLRSSDKCFEEFCEERFEAEQNIECEACGANKPAAEFWSLTAFNGGKSDVNECDACASKRGYRKLHLTDPGDV